MPYFTGRTQNFPPDDQGSARPHYHPHPDPGRKGFIFIQCKLVRNSCHQTHQAREFNFWCKDRLNKDDQMHPTWEIQGSYQCFRHLRWSGRRQVAMAGSEGAERMEEEQKGKRMQDSACHFYWGGKEKKVKGKREDQGPLQDQASHQPKKTFLFLLVLVQMLPGTGCHAFGSCSASQSPLGKEQEVSSWLWQLLS